MIEREIKLLVKAKILPITWKVVAETKTDTMCVDTPGDCLQRIEQGYLHSSKYAEIRVRRCEWMTGERDYRMALKFGNGFKRIELERYISERLYQKLIKYAKPFNKTRVMLGGWSVDFFHGRLRGLVLAEYEDSSSGDFTPPELPEGVSLVADVTESAEFANKRLSRYSGLELKRLARKYDISIKGEYE